MNVLIDLAQFNIQKTGGVSIVWQEIVTRLLKEKGVVVKFLEYDGAYENNIQRREMPIDERDIIRRRCPIPMSYLKFLDVTTTFFNTSYIYHPSVLRINHSHLAKNINTIHDFTYERYYGGLQKWTHSIKKAYVAKKSDAIICISESTKHDLLNYIRGVDENKIYVVHNGVSEDYHPIKQLQYQLKLPFEDKTFALFVGGRDGYKNFNAAVKACKENKFPLVIASGGDLKEDEMAMLNEELGEGHYSKIGKVTNHELNELYNRALMLIYPSLYEGFGIPIIEAQKAGCPVVCLANSSIIEVMGNSDFCLGDSSQGAISDAVRTLIRDYSIRDMEIKRGFVNSSRFSWDKTYRETMEVYKKVMA